ncbi:MAG: hypothetical protein BWZ10_02934 [candidate division BRC1 bacterium ADurb.BinA364]|nr:MAG: hypothetical protein BWZ10_02934 [candidate division BRC1 bacterium ADurb.BinA364]
MRREDDVVERQQRVVGRGRLLFENIECRAAEMARAQRRDQGRLVDHRAAGGVDQQRPGARRRQPLGVEEAARRFVLRQMDADRVGLGQCLERVLRIERDSPLARSAFRRDPGAARRFVHRPGAHRRNAHAQPEMSDARDSPADGAESEDGQRLAFQFDARPRSLESALAHKRVLAGDMPRQGAKEPDGMLGHARIEHAGSVGDHDAASPSLGLVHSIVADAETGDDRAAAPRGFGQRVVYGVARVFFGAENHAARPRAADGFGQRVVAGGRPAHIGARLAFEYAPALVILGSGD